MTELESLSETVINEVIIKEEAAAAAAAATTNTGHVK